MTRWYQTFASVAAIGCHRPPEVEAPLASRTEIHMGTAIVLSADTVASPAVEAAFAEAFAEFARVEDLCSEWREGTPLAEVNRHAGDRAVVVPRELFDLVQRALWFWDQTDGAFDPTFAAMWGLWTFGDDGVHTLPDPSEVERRRVLIDASRVELDAASVSIRLPEPGMKLGLGGIAKGYATDHAVALLRDAGLTDFAVQAGGELYVSGDRDGRPWRVGVRDPRGQGTFARLDLRDAAFDTSGDYERFFEVDGVRYHHILDPKTGWPATASRSATVLASDATTADALSTALFVLGPEAGREVLSRFPGVEAVWVDGSGKLTVSEGLRDRLEILYVPSP